MLGQPLFMLTPQVIGCRLTGTLPAGVTATDLTLTITQLLRKKGVVDKFVEFYGPGVSALSLADRATIANMAPEYGATCGFFPFDQVTLDYLRTTNRPAEVVDRCERYYKAQGLWRTDDMADPIFTDTVTLDLSTVEPSLAGPKRPQDRVPLHAMQSSFRKALAAPVKEQGFGIAAADQGKTGHPARQRHVGLTRARRGGDRRHHQLHQHLEPSVHARRRPARQEGRRAGLTVRRTSRPASPPASRVVTEYLTRSRDCCRTSSSSAFTSSATAAPPASATRARCPEIERSDHPAGDLVAAACCRATATSRAASTPTSRPTTSPRRRWWSPTRWPAPWTATWHRARSATTARSAGLPERHLADRRRGRGDCVAASSTPACSRRYARRLRRRPPVEGDCRPTRATSTLGRRPRPTSRAAVLRDHQPDALARSPTSAARPWRCSATR
jgi:hypothetical protein